jgi:hypothetical protein
MSSLDQTNNNKAKIDFRTLLLSISFMVFIFLLVTLMMPRSGTIGIILQAIAGLAFIIDQIKKKVIDDKDFEKLKDRLNNSSFRDKIPLTAIPLFSPLILVMYFKFGTNTEWYNAFLSILTAVAVSSVVYLLFVTTITNFILKFNNSRNSFARHASYRPYLWSNLLVLSISFIALVAEFLSIYPLSQILHGNSLLTVVPSTLYLILLMFTSYAFLLSFMYFLLYVFLKILYSLSKVRIKISESDKIYTRSLFWLFLIVCWTWGGILLIINSKSTG